MAGLVPAIHVDRSGTHLRPSSRRPDVVARDKPGHDGGEGKVMPLTSRDVRAVRERPPPATPGQQNPYCSARTPPAGAQSLLRDPLRQLNKC
ncbi:hypothetical protein D7006_07435 [Xanthobacter sp. YC-JY1]|nr:hypothetical protein D7006_07435 [Xanthobacter sp. YC-JY1]